MLSCGWKGNFPFFNPVMERKLSVLAGKGSAWREGRERRDRMRNRLEAIRRERGITQEELASALEVSRQTIGSLENGRYNPSILLAFKIARYFGLSIEEIFIYEEEQG